MNFEDFLKKFKKNTPSEIFGIKINHEALLYITAGDNALQENNYSNAIAKYTKAIELDQKNWYSFSKRGKCYQIIQDYDKALKDLFTSKALNDNFENNQSIAECYLFIKDFPQAINYFDISIKKLEKMEATDLNNMSGLNYGAMKARALNNQAVCHFNLQQLDKAINCTTKGIDANPNYPNNYMIRGLIYLQNGQKTEAIRDLQNADQLGDNRAKPVLSEVLIAQNSKTMLQTNFKLQFPTRNEARGILSSLEKRNDNSSISIKDLCSYTILCYKNKHNVSFVTFTFTNALVDMFPDMNVNDENNVDSFTLLNDTIENIDTFFIKHIGSKLEEFIQDLTIEEQAYDILMDNSGPATYDTLWFNNSDKFIHPLLASYQEFKKNKGMLFQKEDIKQIPIDYAIVICYNHFIQNGFINKDICSSIIRAFVDATNNCLNTFNLSYDEVGHVVFKDLANPKAIKAAFDFIKQL